MNPKLLLITAALFFSIAAKAQNAMIDSLQKVLLTQKEDTNKVNSLNALSRELKITGDYDKAKQDATDALSLSQKIGFRKGAASAYNNIGNVYGLQGNYPNALSNYFAALKIREEIGDKKGIADSYNNIGIIYYDQGNYAEALKNHSAALKIREEIGDNKGISVSYNNIGNVYSLQGNYPDALSNYFADLKIAEEIGDKTGIADSYNNIGLVYQRQGNYAEALKNDSAALKIKEEMGEKHGMAYVYNNIGIIYSDQGNYPEALKKYFACLQIAEEIGDKQGIAMSYSEIGIIYEKQGNYPEALKNHFSSLKIYEEIGAKREIARSYSIIGDIYSDQGNYPEALKKYFASLQIAEEIGEKYGVAVGYNSIGEIYKNQGNYPEALKNYLFGLKIGEEIGNKNVIAGSYYSLGSLNTKLKRYPEAKKYLDEALSLSKEIGDNEDIKNSYGGLSELDSATGNWKDAYLHHKLFVIYRDSLINEENTKKIVQTQMQYDFDKKEAATKAAQDKKDAIALKEKEKQKLIRNSFIGAFTTVLFFSIIVFYQRNKIAKGKKRSDELLLNILPAETAEELKKTGAAKAKDFNEVTVLFTDFKNFTIMSEQLTAQELVNEINYCYSAFDNIITKHGIEKIKTIGDSYMCAGGLPVEKKTNPQDTLMAALEIRDFILHEKEKRQAAGKPFFEIRIGLHTGPVVAGIVGIKKYSYDIWGDTVNIASRMENSGTPGRVNISGSTYELVKDKFTCTHRGKIEAKNKGEIDMYFVEGTL